METKAKTTLRERAKHELQSLVQSALENGDDLQSACDAVLALLPLLREDEEFVFEVCMLNADPSFELI